MVNSESRIICLLFFIVTSASHVFCVENTVYAETGQNYTFKPQITGKCQTILWKLNHDKVVEFEDDELKWFQFHNQGYLNIMTGDLTLMQLKKADSGQYESEIQVSGKLRYSTHNLQVINVVGVPIVTCEVGLGGEITLRCSVPNSEPAEFEWAGPDGLTHKGEMLVLKETKRESVYFCTVTNKVSKNSGQFTLEECYPKGKDGSAVAITAGVLIPIIILGVLAVVFRKKIQNYLPLSTK